MDAEALKQYITELLSLLEVSFESVVVSVGNSTPPANTSNRGGRTVVAITTNEQEKLIGQSGDTLRALTLIARRMVEAKYGAEAATFLIDINGKQEALLEGVRQNARMLAQRARLFKHDVEMPPLNPYERLVVHELFAGDAEIKTESAGEGKFRHIVLKYSGK